MPIPAEGQDAWTSGSAYESYVGRWSRLVATAFLDWLAVSPGSSWLEVGCGTGVLTDEIVRTMSPARVTALDASAAYVDFARARVKDPHATFEVGDARALPHADHSVDAVVSGLVLNFVPQPASAVQQMRRVAAAGGVVAAYVWDYQEGTQLMRYFWDAAVALDSSAASLDEGRRFPVCRPDTLAALFADAGLRDVETRAIEIPMRFRDFDDYWSPFLGGQGPAPGYVMQLDASRRERLRERLRSTLPTAPDGAIDLRARAWAVRGRVPVA